MPISKRHTPNLSTAIVLGGMHGIGGLMAGM